MPSQEETATDEIDVADSIVVKEEESGAGLGITVSQSPGPIWPTDPAQSGQLVTE